MAPGRLYMLVWLRSVVKSTEAPHSPQAMHSPAQWCFFLDDSPSWDCSGNSSRLIPPMLHFPSLMAGIWIQCQDQPPVTRHRARASGTWPPATQWQICQEETYRPLKRRAELTHMGGGGACKGRLILSFWYRPTFHRRLSPVWSSSSPLQPPASSWGTLNVQQTRPTAVRVLWEAGDNGKDPLPSHQRLRQWLLCGSFINLSSLSASVSYL